MRSTMQLNLPPTEVNRVDRAVTAVDGPRSTAVNEMDREREWVELFERAYRKVGYTQKTAAATLDTDKSQFCAQLACAPNKHLSFRKSWRLGPDFWRELVLLICEFHDITIGSTQQDVEDARIGKLVREVVTRCR